MPFLKSLNKLQLKAATHTEGPLLVLAGAGSGKTRVLTSRIANLVVNAGVPPAEILAVTFTNKAAAEIKERLKRLIGARAEELWTGTFHTIGLNILRAENELAGHKKGLTIYDEEEQALLIRLVMSELGISEKKAPYKAVQFEINMARNENLTPSEYAQKSKSILSGEVYAVFRAYEKKLEEAGAVDFGSLICAPIQLLSKDPAALERYASRFRHILVDEYQDTNSSQYRLTRMLASKHRNLCVVGDPDQSIYGWRGADVKNILGFQEDYPDAKFIKLEENYRSMKNILSAANSVISNNEQRLDKTLWTKNPDGKAPLYEECLNEEREAAFVVSRIKKCLVEAPGLKLKDFVILYRTNTQSRPIEEMFFEESIPYAVVGGFKFYDRREIKDALAYLKALVNPDDSLNFLRIVNVPPRGIGRATLDKVHSLSKNKGLSLYEAFKEAASNTNFGNSGLRDFIGIFENLRREALERSPADIAERVFDLTGYMDFWSSKNTEDALTRAKNLDGLVESIKKYETRYPKAGIADYLSLVALMSDADDYKENDDCITLMTIHAAKGLEFPVVFMVGMEEGLFPHERSIDDEEGVEEERRLCYVGMTRAKRRLFMSSVKARSTGKEVRRRVPSRFIGEIDSTFLSIRTPKPPAPAEQSIEAIRKLLLT
ncbi:MAG: UvrD-helicase domain-containing protein [Proteobacteria bacterium]|nr:UvrD-helicase domain-containing protein [Pseudomonadota bacterium]